MKISDIQKLYRNTSTKKLDKKFYIEFYQFCIDSIEKIEDEKIIKAFNDAANSNCNIQQFKVYEKYGNIFLELWKSNITLAFVTDLSVYNQKFDLHGFSMWISLDPYVSEIALEWHDNGFDIKAAKDIFGAYFIREGTDSVIISKKFFT